MPDNPQQKDVVVFTGCALVMMPDKISIISDILEKLKLDFVIVGGGELCCGARYLPINLDKADTLGKTLLYALGTFKPKQVIFCCAGCAYYVTRLDKEISPAYFKYDEMFHFLSQHVTELEFTHSVNKKVTLHDPCSFSRGLGDNTSLRTILKAIPGLKLIEMNSNNKQSICCGVAARRKMPEISQTMVNRILKEATETGAEVMVDACQGCHLQFCPEEPKYPFQIEHLLTLMGEAMGINYEDKVKKFYRYGDADKIMAESRENIEAGPYDPGFAAYLAKSMFSRPTP
jgi:Fe-S oxidoreductase